MKASRIRFIVPILLFCLLLRPVSAAEAASSARHSLWKIQGRTNAVYLLGSIHLLKRGDYPLAAPIESAFSSAQVVAFETDMDEMESGTTQAKMMEKVLLPDGETLKGHLSPSAYTNFARHAEEAGMPVFALNRFRPAMAAITLEVFELEKLGADPAYGVDRYFFDRAGKEGKRILPLETVDFQIGLITEFSKAEEELIVKTTLEEIDNTRKFYGEMVEAWRTGDAPKLAKLLNEAEQQAPAVFKRLVTDRNERWVPQIEQLLRDGKNAIIIVGAGHLVGDGGVVQLLSKRGLTVVQQ